MDLTSVLWPDPVSILAAEVLPEGRVNVEATPFPCWLGETWQCLKEETIL